MFAIRGAAPGSLKRWASPGLTQSGRIPEFGYGRLKILMFNDGLGNKVIFLDELASELIK